MLKRKAEENLNTWFESKDALLVTGARQVGKSYLIREFGKTHFKSFIEINLHKQPELIPALEKAKQPQDLYLILSLASDNELIEKKTLIFIDEIQEAKKLDLITLSKFLVEDGKYRYIFSGSMLGVELNNIASWPVGYMQEFKMYPLDFEEFLWAVNLKESVIQYLNKCYEEQSPVDEYVHERMIDAFYKYLLIGGMPECVQEFVLTSDLKRVNETQKKIEGFYKKDITKYAPEDQRIHVETIYKLVPNEINKKNKRFTLNEIGQRYKIKNIEDDFMWLKKAGVTLPSFNADEPKVPLALGCNNRLVKVFNSDVGLLCYQLMDTNIQLKILSKDIDINFGSIFENFVAQELSAHGFDELYYFNSKKQGEVDFLIEHEGNILPIEVKSGKDYNYHSALCNILNNKEYDIPSAIVLNNYNIKVKGKVIYYPIYMTMFIKKIEPKKTKISLDLSALNI